MQTVLERHPLNADFMLATAIKEIDGRFIAVRHNYDIDTPVAEALKDFTTRAEAAFKRFEDPGFYQAQRVANDA